MKATTMLEKVGKIYQLIVHNENHVQIKLANGKKHNLWPMKEGGIKLQLAGMRDSKIYHDLNKLLSVLEKYDYQKHSDHSRLIELQRLVGKVTNGDAVYCDAGFLSNGKLSKIAVIRVTGPEIDLHVRHSDDYESSLDAEIGAIKFALSKFPSAQIIYSDCEQAVANIREIFPEHARRVRWISRINNRDADKFANMRGGD